MSTPTSSSAKTGLLSRFRAALRSRRVAAEARTHLHGLSDRELRDIGLTRDAIDNAVSVRRTGGSAPHAANMNGDVMTGAIHGLTRAVTGNWWTAA